MGKLKAYFWKSDDDADTGYAIIAHTSKEAKNIGSNEWGKEIGHDDPDWFINQRCNLLRSEDINIEGLCVGIVDDYKDGVRRGLYAWCEDTYPCDECNKMSFLSRYENKALCDACIENRNISKRQNV